VAAEVTYVSEGTQRQLVVCSAYLPYDKKESPPTRELRDLVAWCEKEKKQLIVGCDANSHHTVWGSSDVNDRGESLLDFLFSYNLEILNVGNEPTFVIKNRSEVIDITVGSGPICNNIARWHVSNEPSMSDHRHIHFEIITDYNPQVRTYRDPKRTDWDSYRTELQARTREICTKLRNTYDLERAVEELQNAVTRSYEYSCPIKVRSDKHTVPWWSKELTQLRGQTRKLFNRAKRTGEWEAYRATLTEYNKEIRKAKRDSWRKFCEDIDSVPQCAKLQRLLSKNGHTKLGSLKAPSGEYTKTGRETLELLLNTHFPGSRLLNHGDEYDWNHQQRVTTGSRQNWEVAKTVVSQSRIRWAISSFDPFKSPGADGILPVLLQQGVDCLAPVLIHVFRASIALGYIPLAWRSTNVAFIPKPGRPSYAQAKAYRPISLTSFLLKTLERIVDRHIRDGVLRANPLHRYQYAYQAGRSVDTALHSLVSRIERAMDDKDLALAAFLDIEGAFDNTPFESINSAVRNRGLEDTLCRWIDTMLRNRTVTATLSGETSRCKVGRGCPQGGVLSPLLWGLVVDGALEGLNRKGVLYTRLCGRLGRSHSRET
jgi:Reverse transcriptase (RNA-dependent DNA polymerase).